MFEELIESIKNNKIKKVKLLLADKRVDPSDYNNEAIKDASSDGYLEVVKLLLADKRVDPSDHHNKAIKYAIMTGNEKIVELLLKDKRFVTPPEILSIADDAKYSSYREIELLLISHIRKKKIKNIIHE